MRLCGGVEVVDVVITTRIRNELWLQIMIDIDTLSGFASVSLSCD